MRSQSRLKRSRGAHVPGVGQFNTSVVLELIRRASDGIERATIADRSGLSPQTISNVTRRLIDGGVVSEKAMPANGPGKPPSILALNADSRFAVGIHLDPAVLAVTVMDLNGICVVSAHESVGSTDPQALITDMARLVSDAIANSGAGFSDVIGIGVATPGPIDAQTGTIRPPLLPGWDQVPLRDILADLTGFPVLVERDVDAGAIGELWRNPVMDDFLFVYYGTGLNSAIALDRQIVRGTHHRAGRLAHLWSGPGGGLCECGKYGCLGRSLDPQAIVSQAHGAGVQASSLAAVANAASSCDTARVVLADIGRRLAEAIVSLAGFLDVPRVQIGGPNWATISEHARPTIVDMVAEAEAAGRCGPLEIDETVNEDIAATGAASMVLDAAFSPHTGDIILAG